MKLKLLLLASLFILAHCKNKTTLTEITSGCNYSYNKASTKIKWTAYKFTSKVGVKGKFTRHSAMLLSSSNSIAATLVGLSFKIDTNSIDSGNDARDTKLRKIFFGKMKDTHYISGKILGIDKRGDANIELKLNGITKNTVAKISLGDDSRVLLKTKVSVNDFQGQVALAALHKACEAKHTGKDKKSILWPNVDILVATTLTKNCK